MRVTLSLVLAVKAHLKASEELLAALQARLLADSAETGVWAESGAERVVVVVNEPRLTDAESKAVMRTIHAQAPGAVKHFLGAKLNQEAVAAARGSDSPELRAAAKLVTAAFDAKRRRQTADGKDRTVQVTVAPERVAAHRQAILDSLREVYDHRESPTPARVLAGVTDGFE